MNDCYCFQVVIMPDKVYLFNLNASHGCLHVPHTVQQSFLNVLLAAIHLFIAIILGNLTSHKSLDKASCRYNMFTKKRFVTQKAWESDLCLSQF